MITKSLITIIILAFLYIWFVPIRVQKGDFYNYCWYRFGVYECYVIESEGEGDRANVPLWNIYVDKEKKIGGTKEFLLLKEINNEENNKH